MKFINSIKLTTINYYYSITVLIYFCAIYLPFIRVGLAMSLIMGYGIFILYKNKKLNLRKGLDVLVLIYLVYNLLTIFFYLFSEIPLSVFFREFSNSILPIIPFYFFGRLNYDNSFFKITSYSIAGCFAVGFYYQLSLPMNYMERLHVMEGSGKNPLGYLNYRTFLGVTATGSLGAISMFLLFNSSLKDNSKFAKIFFVICTLGVILSFRRAALYSSCFAIIFLNIFLLLKSKRRFFKLFIYEFLIMGLVIYWTINTYPEFLSSLLERFNSLSSAIAERSDSWFEGLSNTTSIITGDGLGKYGHKVVEFSDLSIPDGNYFRMIAEIGILGFLIFVSIISTAIYKGFLKIRTHYVQLIVIFIICLQSVGSDLFSFQLVAPIFWYSIGACNKLHHPPGKKELKQTN